MPKITSDSIKMLSRCFFQVGNSAFCYKDQPAKRERVYLFLLSKMSNDQKFATLVSIVSG